MYSAVDASILTLIASQPAVARERLADLISDFQDPKARQIAELLSSGETDLSGHPRKVREAVKRFREWAEASRARE